MKCHRIARALLRLIEMHNTICIVHIMNERVFSRICYPLTIPKTSKGMPRYTSGKTREEKLQRSKMACLQRYIPDILKGEEGYH